MPRTSRFVAVVCSLFVTGSAAAQVQQFGIHPTPEGVGPIRFGMTLAEASKALGRRVVVDDSTEACTFADIDISGHRFSFMVEDRRLVRVDFYDDTTVTTTAGARIGMIEDSLKLLYRGHIRVERHAYEEEGHYIIYVPPTDTSRRIVFETSRGRVFRWRAGLHPPVEYVEGCA